MHVMKSCFLLLLFFYWVLSHTQVFAQWRDGEHVELYLRTVGGVAEIQIYNKDTIYVKGRPKANFNRIWGTILVENEAIIDNDGGYMRLTGDWVNRNQRANPFAASVPPINQTRQGWLEFEWQDSNQHILGNRTVFNNLRITSTRRNETWVKQLRVDAVIDNQNRLDLTNRELKVDGQQMIIWNPNPNAVQFRNNNDPDIGFISTNTCDRGRLTWHTNARNFPNQTYTFPVGEFNLKRSAEPLNPLRQVSFKPAEPEANANERIYSVMVFAKDAVLECGYKEPNPDTVCQINSRYRGGNPPTYYHIVEDITAQTTPPRSIKEFRIYHNNDLKNYVWNGLFHYQEQGDGNIEWVNTRATLDRKYPPVDTLYAQLNSWSNFNRPAFIFGVFRPSEKILRPQEVFPDPLPDTTVIVNDKITFAAEDKDPPGLCYDWIAEDEATGRTITLASGKDLRVFQYEGFEFPGSYKIKYRVYVCEFPECNTTDERRVNVTPKRAIFIPDAFSPNGDGKNDVFEVWLYDVKNVEFTIFNRWGNKIYEVSRQFSDFPLNSGRPREAPRSQEFGRIIWDATTDSGNPVPEGVYVYKLKVVFNDGKEATRSGTITVIR
ncbi:MAG: gliding motility-associated C-terminal domain-containing protein [Bacteroidia bacterium]|nr:gliding motility-associated C-terminal domain-containing protein [Bacteroidia bacterium]MDW8159490.1 gliding motility-associated C-terminal domain-containing protein [Bacteroidia bacterium]